MSTVHSKRSHEFLKDVEKITRHDKTFWGVRAKRDIMAEGLPEWEDLRELASRIKMHTVTHLADYLDMFSKNLEKRGVHVHWAKDAEEFNEIVLKILKDHDVKKMVKSKKSITTPSTSLVKLPMISKSIFSNKKEMKSSLWKAQSRL